MARKYDTVDIDGVMYEKHSVKVDNKAIGSVPVRCFVGGSNDFKDFVANTNQGEAELIVADYKYGLAVRLQGMARKCVSGEGFSDAAMNKTYAALTPEECARFHQDQAGLVKFWKEKGSGMQAEDAEGDDGKEDVRG